MNIIIINKYWCSGGLGKILLKVHFKSSMQGLTFFCLFMTQRIFQFCFWELPQRHSKKATFKSVGGRSSVSNAQMSLWLIQLCKNKTQKSGFEVKLTKCVRFLKAKFRRWFVIFLSILSKIERCASFFGFRNKRHNNILRLIKSIQSVLLGCF